MSQENTQAVHDFLARLYAASEQDEHQAADVVFDFMDDCLLAGNFDACNLALELADVERILPSGAASLLMATSRAQDRLPARAGFQERASKVFAIKVNGGRFIRAHALSEEETTRFNETFANWKEQ